MCPIQPVYVFMARLQLIQWISSSQYLQRQLILLSVFYLNVMWCATVVFKQILTTTLLPSKFKLFLYGGKLSRNALTCPVDDMRHQSENMKTNSTDNVRLQRP